ncbi:tRNA(fMet)-specific endonuclease VapC [Alishewanella sp. HH-ZS]|uniref:type II toxin-antitoxin system tRNA(fMet)-specific endonuclease VapC n=1 Tax=Alishewanella sp. HH-ZS TaxID=1856684 RepID=UPI0008235A55|nr:tRNA(fMet)-specific endonuclease VapC [Alishewanella sp. HH-ZS]OCW96944.1 plasmid maintenance protein [Alishewanella sp. HH-ZS]
MLKYMLDTNICIYVIKHRPVEVLETFNKYAGLMCISSITYAELCHGVEKSARPEQNRKVVEDFVSRLETLQYGEVAAQHYGEIRAELEKKGNLIGLDDIHIAGHCRSKSLSLVTNNTKEFISVSGLRLENWIKNID